MTKYHIRRSGNVGMCSASYNKCPYGGPELHFDNIADAQKEAEEQLRWEFDSTKTNKRPKRKGRISRAKRPNDPPVIGDNYEPHSNPDKEEERQEERYVENNENPNMRQIDNPDNRYLGAQERSIRQSELSEEDTDTASENYLNPRTGLIEYEVADSEGDLVQYKFNQDGKLHSLNDFAYEDHNSKVRYYKGIVHADEEEDGPAVVLKNNGGEMYIKYGLLHRQNGPAVVTPHEVEYWRHGLLHRNGGPAIMRSNGEEEYWDKGEHVRTVVPDIPKPPESFIKDTKAWWNDPEAVAEAEYQKRNYI